MSWLEVVSQMRWTAKGILDDSDAAAGCGKIPGVLKKGSDCFRARDDIAGEPRKTDSDRDTCTAKLAKGLTNVRKDAAQLRRLRKITWLLTAAYFRP